MVALGPLLTTKLHVPRRRRGLLARPRLVASLDRGDEAVLTLVSAPAGFGKTSVLTEWLAPGRGRSVAWLSLDLRDNDPVVFWTYVVSALQAAADGVGSGALALLEDGPASVDDVLVTLVNDLDRGEDHLVLVLDDYHVITARDVHDRVAALLEHLPARVHVVIATRADPPLPLARMRARGELVEVRSDDLRFTVEEAGAYLTGAMGLALSTEHVAALDARTEGWVAALQLAALSMQGRDDVSGFIAGFAGDDRYVVDYLAEEVLQRQPDDVRTFLLHTAVLSRMCGPLCDAVTGRGGGTAMLQALERANLFVVPLDDRRHWYRYHHLFADVLRARLLDEEPGAAAGLHRRASDWYDRNGEPSEAIRHALAAGDPERAADLVERAMPAARRNREETTLRHWLTQLPEEVLRHRPVLRAGYAGAMLVHGELDGVEEHLRDAERWLEGVGSGATVPAPPASGADEALVRAVRCQVAVYRAAQARMTGDVEGTIEHARRVLDLADEDDHLDRGSAAGLLALAHWSRGELGTAYRWWTDSRDELDRAGHAADTLGVSIALGDIATAQGRLREAMATYERGLATGAAHGPSVLRGTADMHVGLSELFRERDDLDSARRHLAASAELGDATGLPQNRHRWRVASARLRQVEGNLDAAVGLLDEAERLYVSDLFPDVRPIAALRARVWLAQGRVGQVLAWTRERGLSAEDELSYLREFEHVTLARALLAHASATRDAAALARAAGFVDRLLLAAREGERAGSVLELLVLLGLARRAAGDVDGAVAATGQALALAEPEGSARVFLDEGPGMISLLRVAAREGPAAGYASQLLASTRPDDGTATRRQQQLVDPLSPRELDILRLLATDLDGPAIARELYLSLNTVRTHTRHVYAKLGVTSRRAAVRRAAELDLLSRAPEG